MRQRESEPPPRRTRERQARRLARSAHYGQLDRYGLPLIDHVERVTAAVPESGRAVAWVHDVCERSKAMPAEVAVLIGLDADEHAALVLLTKHAGEPLEEHTQRIIDAEQGAARELALIVKRADLLDHIARSDSRLDRLTAALRAVEDALDRARRDA